MQIRKIRPGFEYDGGLNQIQIDPQNSNTPSPPVRCSCDIAEVPPQILGVLMASQQSAQSGIGTSMAPATKPRHSVQHLNQRVQQTRRHIREPMNALRTSIQPIVWEAFAAVEVFGLGLVAAAIPPV